jgi:hypothetical protein
MLGHEWVEYGYPDGWKYPFEGFDSLNRRIYGT